MLETQKSIEISDKLKSELDNITSEISGSRKKICFIKRRYFKA